VTERSRTETVRLIRTSAAHTGNRLLDTLVEAVRDVALAEAEKEPASRDLVLDELARHEQSLFRRLSLFVLARFGSTEQVADALADRALIDDVNVWHEYAELLRAASAISTPRSESRSSR